MTPLLLLFIIFLFGYLVTHVLIIKISKTQYSFVGFEYIIFGILIGPSFINWLNTSFHLSIPQLIDDNIITQIKPGILLVLGFLGLIFGLKFKFKYLFVSKKADWLLTFFEIIFSFIFIGGISFCCLYWFFFNGSNLFVLLNISYLLAVTGFLSSHSFIQKAFTLFNLSGSLSKIIYNNSYFNINIGILLYGILFGIFRADSISIIKLTSVEWVVLSLFFSALMGFLFFMFLGNEKDENKIYLALIGIVIFSTGVAFILNFSPLYINFIIGVILTNVSKIGSKISEVFVKTVHPIRILIAIFAGIFWIPSTLFLTVVSSLLFIFLRYTTKMFAGFFTYASLRGDYSIPKSTGTALLSTDILAFAMVVEYNLLYSSPLNGIAISAILSSVLFYYIYGYYKAKNFLIDFDEIKSKNI